MSDLISRQAAIDAIHEDIDWLAAQGGRDLDLPECMERAKSILENLPSAQPERKKGEWIDDYDPVNFGEFRYKCSECGARTVEWADNFCYHCGADMRSQDVHGD